MEQRNSKADDTNVYACNLLPSGNWDLFPWTFAGSNVKHSSKYLERNGQCREQLLEAEQLMGELSGRLGGVSHTLWAASMDTLGYPMPGSVWKLWIRHQCPSAQCQRQLLSPARLQTLHQCCSLDMLTYQTNQMPAFQHSLICHLSQGELFLSFPALPSWWDMAAK